MVKLRNVSVLMMFLCLNSIIMMMGMIIKKFKQVIG